jgi:hypothetical protein
MKINRIEIIFLLLVFYSCTPDEGQYYIPSQYYSKKEAIEGNAFLAEYKILEQKGEEPNLAEVWYSRNIIKVKKKWIWQKPETKNLSSTILLLKIMPSPVSNSQYLGIRQKNGKIVGIGTLNCYHIRYNEGEFPPDTLGFEVLRKLDNHTEVVVGEFKIAKVSNGN